MRIIDHIVIHCTATSPNHTVESVKNWWFAPPPAGLGWKNPGYHQLVKADGTAVRLLGDEQVGNGVYAHNAHSIHLSYIGGADGIDTRTPAQRETLRRLVFEYKILFPSAKVLGHRDFPGVHKACPSFDVATDL